MRVLIKIVMALLFLNGCAGKEPQLDWAELGPVLSQVKLTPIVPLSGRGGEIGGMQEVEEADARAYGPVSGVTLFLNAASPTKDSEGLKPHYCLRVEDYSTTEAALKRASEYDAVGTYERLEKVSQVGDSSMISKISIRQWAVARGRRVYALTTDVSLFSYISLVRELKAAISELPET
ncbi:MAG: hypothetical protein AB7U82_05325 [Blastocatellales bacterium]